MKTTRLLHTAFFKFVALRDPQATAQRLRDLTPALMGSILVAAEGINGVLAGSAAAVAEFERALVQDEAFEGCFSGIAFKHSACDTPPFARIKVHVKPQIVAVGVPAPVSVSVPDGAVATANTVAVDPQTLLSPQAWRALLAQDDVVLLDNRNSFEYRLGRFNNAIDPAVSHFKDFPGYVEAHADTWKTQGKRVAMYCTGGIRCEKTSTWMQSLGLEVYQLEGGILNYFQAMPDAQKDWTGECFVFDNRIALDTQLNETTTRAEDVFKDEPDAEWRLQRAQRLEAEALQAFASSEVAVAQHTSPDQPLS